MVPRSINMLENSSTEYKQPIILWQHLTPRGAAECCVLDAKLPQNRDMILPLIAATLFSTLYQKTSNMK